MSGVARLLSAALAVASLSACAGIGPNTSYVSTTLATGDAQTLSGAMTEFVGTKLPAASTTVMLDPPPADQGANALTPTFAADLRRRGFAVVEGGSVTPVAQRVRYLVTSLDNGTLVRLTVGGSEASRFFVRNTAGTLQAGGPFTVREITR